MSVDQFEEAKEANKNENTAMNEQAKVGELRLWDQACKRSIESRVMKGAVMKVHILLAGGLPLLIQSDVLFSNISAEQFPSNLP